ncbi:o-succinylbenzoate synthase [Membranihabitans maritimus]|uniref:o-succinylbenzoate synthase n=1 Tax=Membranihabitans maritimus TaxID=2904244 RepID=UPI001F405510|nr:o-succinylbenzoate synthase [Membranihabitans maritimus]
MNLNIIPLTLNFKFPAGTSRSVLRKRNTYILVLEGDNGTQGWGEAAPLEGLSTELANGGSSFKSFMDNFGKQTLTTDTINRINSFPSARFAMEAAYLDLQNNGERVWFPGDFVSGRTKIPINGLIWMGSKSEMFARINEKLQDGYHCLKLKIGGINFNDEVELLKYIRSQFDGNILELRLDANGSFSTRNAEERLKILSDFQIHSIEQPIQTGKWQEMAKLCEENIVPIALDEELIGLHGKEWKKRLIDVIRPQYLIFKPSLIGGIAETEDFISLSDNRGIGWWMTSALESNVGLNILGQFSDYLNVSMPQGLGTGQLFTNNISSPFTEKSGEVFCIPSNKWGKLPLN